jgi:hypothetical protein
MEQRVQRYHEMYDELLQDMKGYQREIEDAQKVIELLKCQNLELLEELELEKSLRGELENS